VAEIDNGLIGESLRWYGREKSTVKGGGIASAWSHRDKSPARGLYPGALFVLGGVRF